MRPGRKVLYFSTLNIAACLAVVYLHVNGCFWEGPGGSAWHTANFIETFFYWAVPVFFMLTGATLMDYRSRMSTRDYFKRRAVRTLVPYVFWSLVATVWVTLRTAPPSLLDVISNFLSPSFMSIYWFFIPLFGIYLSLPILSAIKPRDRLFNYLIIASITLQSSLPLLCGLLGLRYDASIVPAGATGYAVYPLIGYRLANCDLRPKKRAIIYACGIAGWLMQLIGTFALSTPESGVIRTWKGYTNLPAVMQSIAVFVLFKYADARIGTHVGKRLRKTVFSVAKVTFGVYLIHYYLVLYLPKWLGLDPHILLWRLLGPLLIFVLAGSTTALLRRIPILRRVVGG